MTQSRWLRLAGVGFAAMLVVPRTSAQTPGGTCPRPVAGISLRSLDSGSIRFDVDNRGAVVAREGFHVLTDPDAAPWSWMNLAVSGLGESGPRATWDFGSSFAFPSPGPLDDAGRPVADCATFDRVYVVTVADVARYDDTGIPTPDLIDWPTGLGAPTVDASGARVHVGAMPLAERIARRIDLERGERPLVFGDQTAWWIMNDGGWPNPAEVDPRLGLEVRMTAWVSRAHPLLAEQAFFRLEMTYRGPDMITNARAGIYADPDLGDSANDYVGADTTLGLAFVYDADNAHGGLRRPSAIGFKPLGDPARAPAVPVPLSGPIPPGTGLGNRGLGTFGSVWDAHGAPEMYAWMNGLWWTSPTRPTVPWTEGGSGFGPGDPTTLQYPGDPVTGSWWSEVNQDGHGTSTFTGDRVIVAANPPRVLKPGDEMALDMVALFANGADHLDAVTRLRAAATTAQTLFDLGLHTMGSALEGSDDPEARRDRPSAFTMGAAFPNPFDDRLSVRCTLPDDETVYFEVIDILGRSVESGRWNPGAGTHTLLWATGTWPSGVYLLRTRIGQATTSQTVVRLR